MSAGEETRETAPVVTDGGGSIARKRRRTLILGVAVLIAVAVLSWLVGRATTSTSTLAHQATAPEAPVLTARVVRRRLGTTLQASGTLVAAGTEKIAVGSVSAPNAESIVTASVLHVGQTVANGSVIAQVAGRPVFVFAGTTPMYRTLMSGESGADIAQLQHDLSGIGFGISDTAGSYGDSTGAALSELYTRDGYTPPSAPPAPRGKAKGPIVEPQSEIVFVPVLPARVAATKEPIGKAVGSPAVTLTYGSVIVDATLTAAQGYTAEPGDRATVTLGHGRPLVGVVKSIDRSVQKPRATAKIALRGSAVGAGIGSHVAVTIDAESSAVATLAIPIGALYANGSGSAYVILAGHNPQHLAITVGQAVGGYVPLIDPPTQLLPGTQLVLDSSQANDSGFSGP